ncbi:MAG: EamA family transporter [Coriobacteriia bacterium]
MTTTILLALTTSVLFGTGDFLGGFATRRDTPFAVTGTSHLLSLVLLIGVVLVMPAEHVTARDIAWGAASGVAGVAGVLCLLGAFAVGRMGVVTAVSAALSASLPALYDLARGTHLSTLTLVGFALAICAVVIVSLAPDAEHAEPLADYRPRRAIALAALSGVGFALSFIALSFTSPLSGLVPLVATRVVTVAIAIVLAYRFGKGFPVSRPALPATLGAGVTDVLANVTIVTALRIGPIAIASVLASLFPVVVILLARVFLGERLHAWQRVGVAIAVIAVLLTAG